MHSDNSIDASTGISVLHIVVLVDASVYIEQDVSIVMLIHEF